jgi:hypothetical protein
MDAITEGKQKLHFMGNTAVGGAFIGACYMLHCFKTAAEVS